LPLATRFVAAIVLFSVLCVSATGQQPLTPEKIRQVNKVKKKLAHYVTGTRLDVQLNNGSHQIGTLSQTGSTSFVLVDPASSKSEAIDYLDVKRVQPTRKDYMSQQLGKTANGLPKVAGLALLTVAAIVVLWVVVK
jgi:hypothetical protein